MNVQRPSQSSTQATKKARGELIVTRPQVEVLPDSALVTNQQRPAAKMDAVEAKKPKLKGDGPGQVGTVKPPVTEVASPANAIEKEVITALQGGYENVAAKVVELKDLLTRSRMTQEGLDRINVQVQVLEALQGGKPGVEKKSKDLQRMMMVAMMDERGYKNVTLQIEVLDKVAKDFAPLEKRMKAIDSLTMRALLSPDASMSLAAERRALKAFLHGGAQVASEIATTEKQLSDGVATPQMKDVLTLELSALLGVKGGLAGVRSRVQEVKNLMMVARFDAAGLASVTRELNTLEALEKTLSTLERRANQIGG